MTRYSFIEPLDVLFLRGNKLFGDPGSFGESLVPPWPSAAAGALRSWLLAEAGIDPAAFARGEVAHPELGTPAAPGPFTVTAFHLARRIDGRIEALHAAPADLLVFKDDDQMAARLLRPVPPAAAIRTSAATAQVAVLAATERRKPASGYWLNARAWAAYLTGRVPEVADLIPAADLWAIDARVGVGLDTERRSAKEGHLFSAQAVALCDGSAPPGNVGRVGFLAGVDGAELPVRGMLRLGGDGRAAALAAADYAPPATDLAALARARRCRLVLSSPGIFAGGWRLPGMADDGRFDFLGVRGRVVCAAVARAEVVSGFDLARWQPKPAERAAPAGSVYWIEDLEGDAAALGKLAEHGLWPESADNHSRRAEGFNRVTLAAY